MALKACKECKKEISTDATSCPLCGKKSPHGTSRVVKLALGAVGFVMLMGMCGGRDRSTSASATTSTARAAEPAAPRIPVIVDAVKLWQDYQANEVAADSMYRGKRLLVEGRVAGIRKDFLDHVVVDLESPNQFMHTHATMEASESAEAARLTKGVRTTVLCEDARLVVGSPMLSSCRFN